MGFSLNRRKFLKILGAGGISTILKPSVSEPADKLIPYLIPPFEIIPGVANWYATVCRECPAGCGMIVRVREGRAVKVEGNPQHPVNRGKLCARGQASLHGLYNPERIRQPLYRETNGGFRPISWGEGEELLAQKLREALENREKSEIAFISGLITGSQEQFIRKWLKSLGRGALLQYEAFSFEQIITANQVVFGQEDIPEYDFEKANFILSFGTDFLETWLSPVGYSRAFAARRTDRERRLARFVQVEPRLSLTGANADEWMVIEPGHGMYLALGMIHSIIGEGLAADIPAGQLEQIKSETNDFSLKQISAKTGIPQEKIRALAKEFAQARPSLALGGGIPHQTTNATSELMAINLLNYIVGNVGQTVRFGNKSNFVKTASFQDFKKLVGEMKDGKIKVLLINGLNPAYLFPHTSSITEAMEKVPFRVSFSSYMDETAEKCHLILPDHSPLESWGDYEPREGIHGLMQPVMAPLFQTKALGDVLLSTLGKVDGERAKDFPEKNFREYLENRWKSLHAKLSPQEDFKQLWERALRHGGVFEDGKERAVELQEGVFNVSFNNPEFAGPDSSAFYLLAYPSINLFDGRGANKPWLQEQPDPVTQVVADTWVEMHPQTAGKLRIKEGDVVRLKSSSGDIEVSVHLYEGIHPGVLAVPIGQGHSSYGRYASGVGANTYKLLSYEAEGASGGRQWQSLMVAVEKLAKREPLVYVGGSSEQFNRGIARALVVNALGNALNLLIPEEKREKNKEKKEHELRSLYMEHEHKTHRWGMVIDLQACSGCGACVVACYAENNVPFVGKQRIRQNRIMSWIRIERYLEKPANKLIHNPEPLSASMNNPPLSPLKLRGDERGATKEDGIKDEGQKGKSYADQLRIRFIPMLCQHCDFAPCEPVCPVYATYHTPEGLNAQIYNRCVGTRYCSHNCPYKVRRFNWFTYSHPEPLNWQFNPDVSVRQKGLMEKCTFCIQRIREKKDLAKDQGRAIRDGEIVPACAQTCPTGAITFGDLKDPDSLVSKLSKDSRGYHVLEELNTRPSITYLKRIVKGVM